MKSGRTPFFAMTTFLLLGQAVIPSSAWALDATQPYDVFIVQEDAEIPVGTLFFDFDSELSNSRCEYLYEWISDVSPDSDVLPLSAQGFVSEVQTADRDSCIDNAVTSFHTIVHADSSVFPSTGFNRFGQLAPIQHLILGESEAGLEGVIQFEGEEGTARLVVQPAGPQP